MEGPWGLMEWIMLRAIVFIALVSVAIYRLTRDPRLVKAYCAAHVAAMLLGTSVDIAIIKYYMPRGGLPAAYMNAIFLAPIVFFVCFSLYLCHRGKVLHLADVLMAIAPVVAWGCLVIWGWQNMSSYDVLGAWFVSAGCGGVDLAARYGPETLRARPWTTKTAGYLGMLFGVYLALPWTGAH
jgi:hypothetical protein